MKLPEHASQEGWTNNTQNIQSTINQANQETSQKVNKVMGEYVPKWLYSYVQEDDSDILWHKTRHLWSAPFNISNK
jgi:hypothetical protein